MGDLTWLEKVIRERSSDNWRWVFTHADLIWDVIKAADEMINLVNMPSIPNGLTVVQAWGTAMPKLEDALTALKAAKPAEAE